MAAEAIPAAREGGDAERRSGRGTRRIAVLGFDWVWLLSVWRTGQASRAVSRSHPGWQREFRENFPDLTEDDICGSGFAITGYTASKALGGGAALADIRGRLAKRGLKLMLDYVPNHTGLGHPWIDTHPNYFVAGSEQNLQRRQQNFVRVESRTGPRIFAFGRDPNFDGWPDTLQLDYGDPDLQDARIAELLDIAGQCDGVRCDMAMLILAGGVSTDLGHRNGAVLAARDRKSSRAVFRPSCSWRKCTGTWNGHCSSKGSTTATISGAMIACATGALGRCATTWSAARLSG